MRNKNVVQNLADKKVGTGKRAKIIIAIIALIFICVGAFGGYRYSNATTFPKGVKIDGVDVSGLKTEDAVKKITDANNSFTIEEEGQEPKKISTSFTYDIKSSVRAKIGISSVDPRVLIFRLKTQAESRNLLSLLVMRFLMLKVLNTLKMHILITIT